MHLYLIRHGQSKENTKKWDGTNTNSPLSTLGEAQAHALADWLAGHIHFDHLYASTMQRARQTAQTVANVLGLEPEYDDRLREVGNAYPDGSAFPDDKLPNFHLGVWGSRQPYLPITEDGENWMQFRARIGGFIEWLVAEMPDEHNDINVGVICHGGVIEGVFEHVFHKGPWSMVIVNTHNTGITHLEYRPVQHDMPDWWLHYHNQTKHLDTEQITHMQT